MLVYVEAVNTYIVFVLFWVQSKGIKHVMSKTAGVIEFLDLLLRGGKKVVTHDHRVRLEQLCVDRRNGRKTVDKVLREHSAIPYG